MGEGGRLLRWLLELAGLGIRRCFNGLHLWYDADLSVSLSILLTVATGNTVVQMYGVTHPEFVAKPWHVFVVCE